MVEYMKVVEPPKNGKVDFYRPYTSGVLVVGTTPKDHIDKGDIFFFFFFFFFYFYFFKFFI